MTSLYDLEYYAKKELLERLKEKETDDYIGDIIHEVADRNVPVFYRQLLELSKNSLWLAVEEPEI